MSMISELVKNLEEAEERETFADEPKAKLIREAVDTIRELSEKLRAVNMERSSRYYNGGWIPIEERLPEEQGKYYIVSASGRDRAHVTFAKWQVRLRRFDMSGRRSYWRVTAWMPLPERFREE